MKKQLVLASSSPRRKELLQQVGVEFTQLSVDINEDVLAGETAESYVERLAQEKAQAGFNRLTLDQQQGSVVLAADTTVVCDGVILTKPESAEDSQQMLQRLSGRKHEVMTAIALRSQDNSSHQVVTTEVEFRTLTQAEICAYWQTGEPQDKAGSYGIQGLAAVFVQAIQGSYSNVVGLPLCETTQLLQQFNITLWQDAATVSAESSI
jgi:septum formation protein